MMNKYFLKKLLRAMGDLPRTLSRTEHPRLCMTLLVKDEEEMIEWNLLFHKSMGVDFFIVTDNNSTDNTPAILEKYRRKGWILEVINEKESGYEQKAWVDRMVWLAKTKYHADWVINADADEFWYSPSGSIRQELEQTSANVLCCNVKSMYPQEGVPFWEWQEAVRPVAEASAFDLSVYSIFERQNPKVMHRTSGYLQISMGNHKVTMWPKRQQSSHTCVYHFNVRGRERFILKMTNGGKELLTHKGRHGGRHWRYFYKLYQEGRLNEEYDRVIGTDHLEELRRNNYLYPDNTLSAYFKTHIIRP